MNLDKLDTYFKEQVDSLDHVSVPDTQWNPETSWEKINNEAGARKKIGFWWWVSGAAAIILLFISFWFTAREINSNMDAVPIAANDKVEVNDIAEANKSEIAETVKLSLAENLQGKVVHNEEGETKNAKPESFVAKPRAVIEIDQLVYLPKVISIEKNEIDYLKPEIILQDILNLPSQQKTLAFNRTYIIMKSKQTKKHDEVELKLRVDIAMSSKTDPPGGLLSSIRR